MKRKNKTTKYILAGLFLSSMMGVTTACDPLGIEPTTKVDEERFWENPQLARSYVNNFYFISQSASGDWDTYRQYNFNKRTYDENNGITCFSAPWSGAYKNIRAVNLGIEKISSSSILTEAQKNQFLGECYFFRAFIYFDMEKFLLLIKKLP